MFEYVYLARPDSVIAGRSVHKTRVDIGRALAREHPIDADLVIGVPDSGTPAAVGYAALAPLDRFLVRHRRRILIFSGAIATVSIALLPGLQFDFNPLHLRSVKVESVATLLDLMQDPNTAPNTIDVLTPSLADAAALAPRLEQLPEVDHTITLASFVPEQQQEKLALIEDAALLLDPVLRPAASNSERCPPRRVSMT